jgi:hypothetical protein
MQDIISNNNPHHAAGYLETSGNYLKRWKINITHSVRLRLPFLSRGNIRGYYFFYV